MSDDGGVFVMGIIVGLALGGLLGGLANSSIWREDTVKLGLAQYCPDTGAWAWVGDCEQ